MALKLKDLLCLIQTQRLLGFSALRKTLTFIMSPCVIMMLRDLFSEAGKHRRICIKPTYRDREERDLPIGVNFFHNIKITRDANDNITGAAYMTEAEVAELLWEMDDDPDDKTDVELIPVDLKTVAAGEGKYLPLHFPKRRPGPGGTAYRFRALLPGAQR